MLFMMLLLMVCSALESKVLIISHSFNRPDFIELHAKTFKKFLQDDYEHVVFNDASNSSMKKEIKNTCKRLGIKCFRVPQELHAVPGRNSPGHRHMDGIQYALNKIGYDFNGIVALIDSDMFLLEPFSIEKYLDGYAVAGELQERKDHRIVVQYLSPAIAFMDMRLLPNKRTLSFEGGYIEGLPCDVGGHTYFYLKNNPSAKPKLVNAFHVGAMKILAPCSLCSNMSCSLCVQRLQALHCNKCVIDFIQACPDDIEFFLDSKFLHYRSGSNWNNKPAEYHQAKTRALNKLIMDLFA